MTCPNATFPININSDYNKKECSLKCNFSFNYNNSDTTITNKGKYLTLTYDTPSTSKPPVSFSNKNYIVNEIRIYRNSLHTYGNATDDEHAAAEMLIYHNSDTTNNPLVVCVPIIITSDVTNSSKMFKNFLNLMATTKKNSSPKRDNTGSLNLNDFVPNKPFYSYIGSAADERCEVKKHYLVYDIKNAINMSQESFNKLEKIITKSNIDIQPNKNVYYNKTGPQNTIDNSDDIYIKCQPTDSKGKTNEELYNLYDNKSDNPSGLNTILNTYFPNMTKQGESDIKPQFMNDLVYYGGSIIIMIIILFILWKIAVFFRKQYKNKTGSVTSSGAPPSTGDNN
jgi:carbonic anhydrase